MSVPLPIQETLLATDNQGRRLQTCRDTFREGDLSITVDCCGSGVSDLSDCDCSISIGGDRCQGCSICSDGDVAHDCRDEACGSCGYATCSGGCRNVPCDDDDDDFTAPSPTVPSPVRSGSGTKKKMAAAIAGIAMAMVM